MLDRLANGCGRALTYRLGRRGFDSERLLIALICSVRPGLAKGERTAGLNDPLLASSAVRHGGGADAEGVSKTAQGV